MAKITIKGARFQGFIFSCGPKRGDGGPVVVSEWSATWTDENRAAGAWDEIPQTVSGNVSLVPGELAATRLEFKPRGLDGIEFECSKASGFHVFIPTKEGEPRELRFQVKTSAMKAGCELDTFGRTVGTAAGTLRISHDEDAQTTLDGVQRSLTDEE